MTFKFTENVPAKGLIEALGALKSPVNLDPVEVELDGARTRFNRAELKLLSLQWHKLSGGSFEVEHTFELPQSGIANKAN